MLKVGEAKMVFKHVPEFSETCVRSPLLPLAIWLKLKLRLPRGDRAILQSRGNQRWPNYPNSNHKQSVYIEHRKVFPIQDTLSTFEIICVLFKSLLGFSCWICHRPAEHVCETGTLCHLEESKPPQCFGHKYREHLCNSIRSNYPAAKKFKPLILLDFCHECVRQVFCSSSSDIVSRAAYFGICTWTIKWHNFETWKI